MERDKLLRELQAAEARLRAGEKSGQGLTEEHAALKKSYLVLAEAHDKELAQSEQLSAELLALAQAQDALRRQLEEQQQDVKTTTQGLHGELDRVKALISRMSCNRVKVRQTVHACLHGGNFREPFTWQSAETLHSSNISRTRCSHFSKLCNQRQMIYLRVQKSNISLRIPRVFLAIKTILAQYVMPLGGSKKNQSIKHFIELLFWLKLHPQSWICSEFRFNFIWLC